MMFSMLKFVYLLHLKEP